MLTYVTPRPARWSFSSVWAEWLILVWQAVVLSGLKYQGDLSNESSNIMLFVWTKLVLKCTMYLAIKSSSFLSSFSTLQPCSCLDFPQDLPPWHPIPSDHPPFINSKFAKLLAHPPFIHLNVGRHLLLIP